MTRESRKKEIKRLGVLTGGGDAPGLNPAIRSVVYRAAGATFLVPVKSGAEIVQGVHLTDADGALWLATYRLERQRDGAWRIKGCDVQSASGKMV